MKKFDDVRYSQKLGNTIMLIPVANQIVRCAVRSLRNRPSKQSRIISSRPIIYLARARARASI